MYPIDSHMGEYNCEFDEKQNQYPIETAYNVCDV